MSDAIRDELARKLVEVEAERDALGRLVHDKSVLLQRAEAERDALDALQRAEKNYRDKCAAYGHNSMAAGQARDKLRSAGYVARQVLREQQS